MDKIIFFCDSCGDEFLKWFGICPNCKEYNTLKEVKKTKVKGKTYSGSDDDKFYFIDEIKNKEEKKFRTKTGSNELDRVLGGGSVLGSVTLLSGEPGIGKSTILLSVSNNIGQNKKVLYISGEESLQQIKERAERLSLPLKNVALMSSININKILEDIKQNNFNYCIIDSIQSMESEDIKGEAGGVSQIKYCTKLITQFAKTHNVTFYVVGHVIKGGDISGPKILEHIVDCSLKIEGEVNSRFRILRALKNRFGKTNEIGVFAMTEKGLIDVKNPSELFLSENKNATIGSSITVVKNGNRPIILEIQSLVSPKNQKEDGNTFNQQISTGYSEKKIKLILAILKKYTKFNFYGDVYLSTVGGIDIPQNETAPQISIALSLLSSLYEKPIPKNVCSFGEIGLTGEIRAVANIEERIFEADKHQFKTIIIPKRNYSKKIDEETKINIISVSHISELYDYFNKL